MEQITSIRIAAIAFKDARTAFIATGNGKAGGIFKSVDGGSWTPFNTGIVFSAVNNDTVPALSTNVHPRSTGNLLAFDSTGSHLYAGSFDGGVFRCEVANGQCTNIGMAGKYIRSIALAADNSTLYAAAYNDMDPSKTGLFKGTNVQVGTGEHFAKITGSIADRASFIEELKFLGDELWAVGSDSKGDGQVYKITGGGAEWSVMHTLAKSPFQSIDGYRDAASEEWVILAGTSDKTAASDTLYRSADSGRTWTGVTAHFGPGTMVGGGTWWMAANSPGSMLNGSGHVAAHIAVAPNRTEAYVAGRSGVWKSTDKGANWYPAVRRMNVTDNRDIKVNPHNQYIYAADTDWKFLYSGSWMDDVSVNISGMEPNASGYVVAVNPDPQHPIVYFGIGKRDSNAGGALYSSVNPEASRWTDERLDQAVGGLYSGQRIIGLAAKTVGAAPSLLAAVEGKGIFRKFAGQWTRVSGELLAAPTTKTAPLVWDQSRAFAYVYDRDKGVYRGAGDGVDWTLVWEAPTGKVNVNEAGYLALDEKNDRLYISNAKGLYRIDQASVSSFEALVQVSSKKIGPIAFAGGQLYAAGLATNIAQLPTADMYTYTPEAGLVSIGDDFYKRNGGFPFALDVDKSGTIYVAMFGMGVLVGKPPTSPGA